jgi:hypothetical protein
VTVGLLLAAASGAGESARGDVDYVADLVARTFLRALFDGDAPQLAPLVAERVSFDGEIVQGAALRPRLAMVAARAHAVGRPRRIVVMSYATARARFGEAPARLRPLGLDGTVVAFARLERGGLVVILKKVGGRWKVVGLSD